MEPQRPELVIVPHTHWDREWYEPFQVFRMRLVTVLDGLLERLAADGGAFTLDGQTAMVDDYLEIRPERSDLVRSLVQRGLLDVGPWRVLADSFLCSGENLVRNLELGLRRGAELGGVMKVGYLPDQFGHCAQLPQILRLAGISHACVWRGVPESVVTTSFSWVAPDGTAHSAPIEELLDLVTARVAATSGTRAPARRCASWRWDLGRRRRGCGAVTQTSRSPCVRGRSPSLFSHPELGSDHTQCPLAVRNPAWFRPFACSWDFERRSASAIRVWKNVIFPWPLAPMPCWPRTG